MCETPASDQPVIELHKPGELEIAQRAYGISLAAENGRGIIITELLLDGVSLSQ